MDGNRFVQVSGNPTGGVDYGLTGGEVTNTGGSTGGRPSQFGRNVYLGPGLFDVDFRISRDFVMAEKYHLQFLGEAFNIFNHTNITSVCRISPITTAFNYASGRHLLPVRRAPSAPAPAVAWFPTQRSWLRPVRNGLFQRPLRSPPARRSPRSSYF